MILWDRIKKSFDEGVNVLRRVAAVVSERARIESAVARHLIEKGSLETRLASMNRDLGERVYQLWERGETDVMKDQVVQDALGDIAAVNEQVEELRQKVRKASLGEEAG